MATSILAYPVTLRPGINHGGLESFASGFRALVQTVARYIEARQQRRAEAVVADYIERHGGSLTDNLERQIERRFGFGS
ncbi:hypothetical protein JNW90_23575 [Micromonospora sp. STR1s_5]|nr:hypothetical protein [Micromonospora sp. STR1s_5]